jgi:mannitol-1-phosphate 5-dehydrogenase
LCIVLAIGGHHVAAKNIVIWGAGRIGRGFVADRFRTAGYHLVFVDVSEDLIARLRLAGRYTVVRAPGAGQRDDLVVGGYQAFTAGQVDEIGEAVTAADAMALAVFPRDFAAVAAHLAPALQRRRAARPSAPLDIILCTNLAHAAVEFRTRLREALPPDLWSYADQHVGVVESLVMRMVAEPPEEEHEREPLLVWTNGNAEFPVDRHAFKGEVPPVAGLRLVDDMRAEEMRKLYTYNTCHAVLAYLGALHGHDLIVDCLADAEVRAETVGALQEASLALQAECGFAADEMTRWIEKVLRQTDNPTVGDRVSRHGADPRRKLRRDDRLIGPLLLARKHGVWPIQLIRATAAAFAYQNACDPGAVFVQGRIAQGGVQAAVREVCELTPGEDDLVASIVEAYHELAANADMA